MNTNTAGAMNRAVCASCFTCWSVCSVRAPISGLRCHFSAVSMWYRSCDRYRIPSTWVVEALMRASKAERSLRSFSSRNADAVAVSAFTHSFVCASTCDAGMMVKQLLQSTSSSPPVNVPPPCTPRFTAADFTSSDGALASWSALAPPCACAAPRTLR